jgi:pyruvate kinase
MSFVQNPKDIDALLRELGKLSASHFGIMLKIETKAAFSRLTGTCAASHSHSISSCTSDSRSKPTSTPRSGVAAG